MAIKYYPAEDIKELCEEIVRLLGWGHIHLDSVAFIRSRGSSARRTIARCHALGKAMQIGMGRKRGFYLVEVIAEQYDKQSEKEKIKTLIHELMHIPKAFGGGFIHHNVVCDKNVSVVYENYINLKKNSSRNFEVVENRESVEEVRAEPSVKKESAEDFLIRLGYKKPEGKAEKQSGLRRWF